jgi:eukaryotic-like serine/threonine-protein kinase
MDTGRPRRIEQFYHAALELDGDARAALLARADPEVRREVESLLAQLCSDSFLARPMVEAAAQLLPTQDGNEESGAAALPSRIGQYRIVERIGAGGMGVVYRAEQEHPRRIVALKVIKSGWANPELLRRFERESQALGRLQHLKSSSGSSARTTPTR